MKSWLKTLSTIVLLVSSNTFIGCKEKTTNEEIKEIKIGVSVYEGTDIFISSIVDNLEELVKEKGEEGEYKFTLTVEDAKCDQYNQNEQVDKFINQNYDVMCINLVDRRSASSIINRAKNSDIPVVFFNREPVEEDMNMWDKVYYIGTQAEQSGIMQADIVLEKYNKNKKSVDKNNDGKIQYLMLEGEEYHQDALIRTEYCIKRLSEGDIKVEKLESYIADWNRIKAKGKTESWIKKYAGKIEVIFSNNDEMALGAIDAFKNLNLTSNMPVVVGVDGIEAAMKCIKEGYLTGTVLSDANSQAEKIFDISYMLATYEGTEEDKMILNRKYIRDSHEIVTKDNVDIFIDEVINN
ncbi:galactose ABC transporter substrate-binding protein [Clostridium sardiniense]|uniref:D-galactose/methyl-galactoside binding periplasmic protein MglB n=1 Tax=Clostridium sardiniense TaxID=29369 RepID=A0ABS7KU76_CLOSR|nr:galactose ABC transporter substrate-binding protein [Clostridium sardiniense]MBY0754364.1 galactose ABC transporter substrate-binding protein [Clostridium sardiniense]MDQ0462025.1 methyl-galactoside transport system substrate-binding protein [Clostridium sardiniense]